MRKTFWTVISDGLLLLANANIASASSVVYYQPKVPESLRK